MLLEQTARPALGHWLLSVCATLVLLLGSGCGREEPVFLSVLAPSDTTDTDGPYRVEARVFAPNGVHRLLLRLQRSQGEAIFADVPMVPLDDRHDGGTFFTELPGRPADTELSFYLLLVDGRREGGGAVVRYPETAPEDLLSFRIRSGQSPGSESEE